MLQFIYGHIIILFHYQLDFTPGIKVENMLMHLSTLIGLTRMSYIHVTK